ncbi:MAG: hypothetical protein RXR51_05675 [Nitrososphaeria archaeon]
MPRIRPALDRVKSAMGSACGTHARLQMVEPLQLALWSIKYSSCKSVSMNRKALTKRSG